MNYILLNHTTCESKIYTSKAEAEAVFVPRWHDTEIREFKARIVKSGKCEPWLAFPSAYGK